MLPTGSFQSSFPFTTLSASLTLFFFYFFLFFLLYILTACILLRLFASSSAWCNHLNSCFCRAVLSLSSSTACEKYTTCKNNTQWAIWFGMNTLVLSPLQQPSVSATPDRFSYIQWTHYLLLNIRWHLGWILGPHLPQILLGLHWRHLAWSRRYPVRRFLDSWLQISKDRPIHRPSAAAAPFVEVIVKAPLLQIIAMILGFFILALEWPFPLMKKLPIYRNLVVRIVILFFQVFINVLYYQVSSRNDRIQ